MFLSKLKLRFVLVRGAVLAFTLLAFATSGMAGACFPGDCTRWEPALLKPDRCALEEEVKPIDPRFKDPEKHLRPRPPVPAPTPEPSPELEADFVFASVVGEDAVGTTFPSVPDAGLSPVEFKGDDNLYVYDEKTPEEEKKKFVGSLVLGCASGDEIKDASGDVQMLSMATPVWWGKKDPRIRAKDGYVIGYKDPETGKKYYMGLRKGESKSKGIYFKKT